MEIVKIPQEVNNAVEKLFYEMTSMRGILEFMIQNQEHVDLNIYNFHLSRYNRIYGELEKLKREVVSQYGGELRVHYPYVFNFMNSTIEFQTGE